MPTYDKIPVDPETKKNVVVLAKKFGLGERGQGAMVRILVNEKMSKLGLLPVEAETPVVDGDGTQLPAIDDVA